MLVVAFMCMISIFVSSQEVLGPSHTLQGLQGKCQGEEQEAKYWENSGNELQAGHRCGMLIGDLWILAYPLPLAFVQLLSRLETHSSAAMVRTPSGNHWRGQQRLGAAPK